MLILDSQTFQIIRIYKWYGYNIFLNNVGSTTAYNEDQNIWFLFSYQYGYYFILFNSSYNIEKGIIFDFAVKLEFISNRYFNSRSRFKNGKVYLSFNINIHLGNDPYKTMTIFSIPTNDIDTSWSNDIYSKVKNLDVS